MSTTLEKRIAALETRAVADPVVLHFADGSERVIRGDSRHWAALHSAWCEMETAELDCVPVPEHVLFAELAAIGRAVRIEEEGQRFGLLGIMLQGPNEDAEESQ